MRAISAAQQGVLDSGVQAEHCRVSIKDSGGTFRDLTTYPGFNAVKVVKWSERVDDPHPTLSLTLARELHRLSLAPLVSASAINKAFNPAGASSALIALYREIKVEVAIVPMDKQPGGSDWIEVFRGRVDNLDAAKGKDIEVSGRGLSGRLAQQFIKTELVYSYAADGGVAKALRIWEPQIAVTTAPLVYLLPASRGDNDPGLNKFLKCSQAGTTGTSEPAWTTGVNQVDGSAKFDYVGAPTTSGRPVEEVIQNILTDNKLTGDPTVTLYTPSSPGWQIRQFLQERTFTLDAIRALATQIGWDIRYKWRSGTAQFELTLDQPNRAFTVGVDSPDHIFLVADYGEPTRLAVDISEIRNSVRVLYADRADLWPDGTPKRKVIEVADSASITKYGELWMEIQEDQTSNIDSSTEATTLANNALSDCKEPTAELAVPLTHGFPWVELNDMYEFAADGVRFDTDQTLAVVSWDHTYEANSDGKACLKTSLQLRGLPTIGARVHIEKSAHPRVQPPAKQHKRIHFQGTKTPSQLFTETVGGVKIVTKGTIDKQALIDEYEIHISKTPGFSPDDTTLICTTKAQLTEHSDLDSGDSYYGRTVPRWFNATRLVRGQPSAEQSFVPGYLKPKHINTELFRGELPANGSFEGFTRAEGLTVPPDQWEMQTGTWATDAAAGPAKGGVDARDGAKYLRFLNTSVATAVRSKWFPVNGGNVHELRLWLYRASMGNSVDIQLEWVTATKAAISTSTLTRVNTSFVDATWNFVKTVMTAPATAAFARFIVKKSSANTDTFHIDGVRVDDVGEPWLDVVASGGADPAFKNSWVNYNTGTHAKAAVRLHAGRWYMKGLIKSGTVPAIAFTLRAEAIPPLNLNFGCIDASDTAAARVEIDTSGNVTVLTGNNGYVALDNISWTAFG